MKSNQFLSIDRGGPRHAAKFMKESCVLLISIDTDFLTLNSEVKQSQIYDVRLCTSNHEKTS